MHVSIKVLFSDMCTTSSQVFNSNVEHYVNKHKQTGERQLHASCATTSRGCTTFQSAVHARGLLYHNDYTMQRQVAALDSTPAVWMTFDPQSADVTQNTDYCVTTSK